MLAEHSSPLRPGSQFTSSDPPVIAQTGHIPPLSGPLDVIVASVRWCCNYLWAPDGEIFEDRGFVIVPLAPAPDYHRDSAHTHWVMETHGPARLAPVVIRRVLRNWGLIGNQGPLNTTLPGYDLLGNDSIPHFPAIVS